MFPKGPFAPETGRGREERAGEAVARKDGFTEVFFTNVLQCLKRCIKRLSKGKDTHRSCCIIRLTGKCPSIAYIYLAMNNRLIHR